MKLAYIAGPYRAKTEYEVHCNIQRAEKAAVRAWRSGYAVICPHKNSAYMGGVVPDESILAGDLAMLRRCDVIILCGGWEFSEGAKGELALARELGLPICDYDEARDRIVMRSNVQTEAAHCSRAVAHADIDQPQGKYDVTNPIDTVKSASAKAAGW
jgi:hypothetical protein